MFENMGYITELTAWHCYQGHMSGTCVWRGGKLSHFFQADALYKHFQSNPPPPQTSQSRGSIPCTGQTWRGWISVLVLQRRANRASLGAGPLFDTKLGWGSMQELRHDVLLLFADVFVFVIVLIYLFVLLVILLFRSDAGFFKWAARQKTEKLTAIFPFQPFWKRYCPARNILRE